MELEKLLDLAVQTAKEAAILLKQHLKTWKTVEQDYSHDVKVEADRKVEAFIIENLTKNSEIPILSEETGEIEHGAPDSPWRWIVDPLDGSVNFSREIPICCISIALWKAGKPVLGVVYDFNREELFRGIVNQGAWCNDRPISVSNTKKRSEAILCTGFPVSTDFSADGISAFVQQVQDFKKVRLLGSAAISLAYVAAGRADFYHENNIKLWDIAAGLALVKAANGNVEFQVVTEKEPYRLNVQGTNQFIPLSESE